MRRQGTDIPLYGGVARSAGVVIAKAEIAAQIINRPVEPFFVSLGSNSGDSNAVGSNLGLFETHGRAMRAPT